MTRTNPRASTRAHVVLGSTIVGVFALVAWVVLPSEAPADTCAVRRAGGDDAANATQRPEALLELELAQRRAAEDARVVERGGVSRRDRIAFGRVTLAGGPLPGSIELHLCDATGHVLAVSETDASGAFVLAGEFALDAGWSIRTDTTMLEAGGGRRAIAPAEKHSLDARTVDSPPIEVRLDIAFPAVLRGLVVDRASGRPLPDAVLRATAIADAWAADELSTTTGPDGRFEIEAGGQPLGGTALVVTADGHRARLLEPEALAGDEVVIELDPALMLRGRVARAGDGAPIAGATITAGCELAARSESTWSAEDGAFVLDLSTVPSVGLWLHVGAPDHAPVAVRAFPESGELAIALEPESRLRGIVVDAEDGRRVIDATVRAEFDGESTRCENGLVDDALTDRAGVFELVLENAPLTAARLVVEVPDRPPFVVPQSEFAELVRAGAACRIELPSRLREGSSDATQGTRTSPPRPSDNR